MASQLLDIEKELISDIENQKLVIVVGSGVSLYSSSTSGTGTETSLLSRLQKEGLNYATNNYTDVEFNEDTPLEKILKKIKDEDEFDMWLSQSIGNFRFTRGDSLLLSIGAFQQNRVPIFSTNIDDSLETVTGLRTLTPIHIPELKQIIENISSKENSNSTTSEQLYDYIFHFNGNYNHSSSVQLVVNDYSHLYSQIKTTSNEDDGEEEEDQTHKQAQQLTQELLKQVLYWQNRSILFIGFDEKIQDPNFTSILAFFQQLNSNAKFYCLASGEESSYVKRLLPNAKYCDNVDYSKISDYLNFIRSNVTLNKTALNIDNEGFQLALKKLRAIESSIFEKFEKVVDIGIDFYSEKWRIPISVYFEDDADEEFDDYKNQILEEFGDQEESILDIDLADDYYNELAPRVGTESGESSLKQVSVVGAKLGVGSLNERPTRVGTATCIAVIKDQDKKVIVTSSHAIGKHPEVFLSSQTNDSLLGRPMARQEDLEVDAAIIQPSAEDFYFFNKVFNENSLEISGILSENQLAQIFAGNDKVTRRRVKIIGANSGIMNGRLIRCGYTARVWESSHQLLFKDHLKVSGAYPRFGDSGAAVVWTDPESKKNYIIGLLRASLQKDGFVLEDASIVTPIDKVFNTFELNWE